VLFPCSGSNLHTFTAVTPCAILDILTPSYSKDHKRPSTYFTDVPVTSLPGSLSWKRWTYPRVSPSLPGFAVLEETELPKGFTIAGAPYLCPELTVDMDVGDNELHSYNDRWCGRIGGGQRVERVRQPLLLMTPSPTN
jgi:cysteamine dioxygenase